MKKIALIYSFNTKNTAQVAKQVIEIYGKTEIEEINAEKINGDIFISFERLILGVSTWFDGELPNYWDEFVPELETLDLKGKKIAIFGNGDQVGYPENFVDGIGILAEILIKQGAAIIGKTSAEGYKFERSRALKDGKLLGLAIDFENQGSLNNKRIKAWVEQLKKEFHKGFAF